MGNYCMYLRKSRSDSEAEARGEGETLTRHQNILTELAGHHKLNIVKIYREIVSGDSIEARPQMQYLLTDVEAGKYEGVLVVEIERLARGDTIDQGIVARTFRESSTKIITPSKIYDPDNEFDEEYFEFSLFMSRREYKTIRRRMQTGRLASVKEGNYIGTEAPYGYRKINPAPKVHTLEIVPEEAGTVRMIYRMYLDGHGAKYIANELNRIGISPQKSRFWEYPSIKKILQNTIYCGMVGWKSKSNGSTLYTGLHKPIISRDIFNAVQEKKKKNPAAQLHCNDKLLNYYHNIMYCRNCGHQLRRRTVSTSSSEYMLCTRSECHGKTVSSPIDSIDEAVISALRYRLSKFEKLKRKNESDTEIHPDKNALIIAELEKSKRQLSRMYDLLEQEIYNTSTFLERSGILTKKIHSLESALKEISIEQKKPTQNEAVVSLKNIIENYTHSEPEEKNRLLHAVLEKIYYNKNQKAYKQNSFLTLNIDFI